MGAKLDAPAISCPLTVLVRARLFKSCQHELVPVLRLSSYVPLQLNTLIRLFISLSESLFY